MEEMNKVDEMLLAWQMKMYRAMETLRDSEDGDTNFISMLLIIGVVVVLAGLFLTFGKTVLSTVSEKVINWINSL